MSSTIFWVFFYTWQPIFGRLAMFFIFILLFFTISLTPPSVFSPIFSINLTHRLADAVGANGDLLFACFLPSSFSVLHHCIYTSIFLCSIFTMVSLTPFPWIFWGIRRLTVPID